MLLGTRGLRCQRRAFRPHLCGNRDRAASGLGRGLGRGRGRGRGLGRGLGRELWRASSSPKLRTGLAQHLQAALAG